MKYDLINYVKDMEERSSKLSEFTKENIEELQKEVIQNKSDIKAFNIVGTYASDKGYDVVYFKNKQIGFHNNEPTLVDIHYIHLYGEAELKLSIFYDHSGISVLSSYPCYELYDTTNVFRFSIDEESELDLINKAISLM